MKKDDKQYKRIVDEHTPKSPVFKNTIKAFIFGGLICTTGQGITDIAIYYGSNKEDAAVWTSVILVFFGALLTGLGWYPHIAKHAGAGTLVPITGFANAVVSPAIEYKTEGMITGVAAKMFIIAGPVIVYGIVSAWVLGIIKWLMAVM